MESKFELIAPQASTMAARIDALMLFLIGVSVFFTILITVLLVFMAVKYRKRSDHDKTPHIHGSTVLETVWTAIPLGIVTIIFFWGASLYFDQMYAPANAMEIFVTGKQWMWKFQHPNGKREINDLHVPKGRPVKLIMATEDVIHDFYVPAFRTKMDVMPGKYNTTWFNATKTGEFHLFCNQYCGKDHAKMVGKIIVMEPEDYEMWLAGGVRNQTPAQSGEKIFSQWACNTCHLGGASARGPNLAGIFGKKVVLLGGTVVVADDNYLRESIVNPAAKVVDGYQPIMPTFKGLLSEEQVRDLVAYIKAMDATGAISATPAADASATTSPATTPAATTSTATADAAKETH